MRPIDVSTSATGFDLCSSFSDFFFGSSPFGCFDTVIDQVPFSYSKVFSLSEKFMSDLLNFQQFYQLADQLIEKSSKEEMAECARLLALNVAHYQSRFGELPLEEKLAMLSMNYPNEEQFRLVASGMEILVGVLGNVIGGVGEEKH